MNYKKPLLLPEQIKHLASQKRVKFNSIDKKTAMNLLLWHNYINVISPFKHHFTVCDKNGYPIKNSNNEHVYRRDVEFKEYYDYYKAERKKYSTMFKNIIMFEEKFNSIISYHVITYYQIDSSTQFKNFQDKLKTNLLNLNYDHNKKARMIAEIDEFDNDMNKYDSIYIFMDRCSLSKIITIFRLCDKPLKNKIFDDLLKCNNTLGYVDYNTFDNDFLNRIVPIRNYICHGNSLEILINYYDIKNKMHRYKSDKKRYVSIIQKLSR